MKLPLPQTPVTTRLRRPTPKPQPQPPSHSLSPPSKEKHNTVVFAPTTPPAITTTSAAAAAKRKRSLLFSDTQTWNPLNVPRSEVSLSLTLPTGQTFRWRKTSSSHYTGVINSHLVSLKHAAADPDGHVFYHIHNNNNPTSSSDPYLAISDYFNLNISLSKMWQDFSSSDVRFAELAQHVDGGARVLKQDPVECLFQFLCSSNNNIKRIEKMVSSIERFGDFLGNVGGFDFYKFPSIERLSCISEQQLRDAGFGYRAKFVVGAVKALQEKPGGGEHWLESLRVMELSSVIRELCTLPGVGPKVASCVALFSLDQHHAIPVDTHVWQIATRYYIPELAGARLAPKLFGRVSDAFVAKFGEYAGWAQTLLFIGELLPQKTLKLLPRKKTAMKVKKSTWKKKCEDDDDEDVNRLEV